MHDAESTIGQPIISKPKYEVSHSASAALDVKAMRHRLKNNCFFNTRQCHPTICSRIFTSVSHVSLPKVKDEIARFLSSRSLIGRSGGWPVKSIPARGHIGES